MLKNMTRKGLALGTGLALVATGFVAAPAQATATGLLWSYYGPTDEMVAVNGYAFTLRVANPTGISNFDDTRFIATQVPVAGQAPKTLAIAALISNDGVEVEVTAPVATETYQYDIYAIYDDGSRSETERIKFVPADSVSAVASLSAVAVPDPSVDVSVTLSGINTENFLLTEGLDIDLTLAQTSEVDIVEGVISDAWDYTEVNDTFSQTVNLANAIAAADVLTLTGEIDGVEVNQFFDEAADPLEVKRTVSAAAAYDGLEISVATSTSVRHNSTDTDTDFISAETVIALEGTKSLNFVLTAYTDFGTEDEANAGKGHEITVTLSDVDNGLDTTTISAGGKTLTKNTAGNEVSFSLTTNSSGQVAFTVTADKALDGETFAIDAIGTLGEEIDSTTVVWQEAAWSLLPAVDGNYSIAPKSSLAVDYTVVDQFGNLANADYQIAFTRAAGAGDRDTAAEYANWSYVAPVSAAGKASVTIVDNGADVEGKDNVTATLQKKATAGGAFIGTDPAATDSFVITYEKDLAALTSTAKVNYNGIANAAGTAIHPIYLETDALISFDQRVSNDRAGINLWEPNNFETDGVADADPAITDSDELLRVYGTVVTTNNAPVAGVAVKLSASGMNFADEKAVADISRASNDSIVVFTDATGSYEAFVRSAVAGRQTISVDAQGAKSSVEVRFQESTGVATGLTLVAPASVNPGARADFVAKVVDKFGKPVSGVTVNFKDNGPGVLSATSAVTDPFGDASVTLTTLAAESGTTTVTAWATIGGQTVSVTKTITVGSAAGVAGKVNVGSFNGKLVVYASGLQGSTISWKVGGNWGKGVASSNYSIFNRPTPVAGATVSVDIYVNGVKTLTKSVVTR